MNESPELVMLSSLQHFLFCRRQCALIHVECQWSENFLTASGRRLHERTDSAVHETRRDLHRATSLKLVSEKYGLMGIADVVEFIRQDGPCDDAGAVCAAKLNGLTGWWRPFPVEYKRGKPKVHHADEVQLCAQALCLEEMLGVTIRNGALFYGETRRRVDVQFDESLRKLTLETAEAVRAMLALGETPPPIPSKSCEACSMIEVCQPYEVSTKPSARAWVAEIVGRALQK